MTQNRVWTAILINWQGHETRVVSVDAPYDTSGLKDYIEAKYPGQCLIAAVPGNHAGHAQAYPLTYTGLTSAPSAQTEMQQLDLFDTGYLKQQK